MPSGLLSSLFCFKGEGPPTLLSSSSWGTSRSQAPPGNEDHSDPRLRVDYGALTFHQLIGKGSFKAVYRGRWNNTTVAIVSMRKGGIVAEARVLQRLSNHPNLVQFYRWAEDLHGNEHLVMEYIREGPLDKTLLTHGARMHTRIKLAMCEQICSAMCELTTENVVHRDLAARNVLVASIDPVHVKVSDFGLARVQHPSGSEASDVAASPFSDSPPASVPIRWSPPEVLTEQRWSEKSDVWSFGVTMWEIFSGGNEPYADKSDLQVLRCVIGCQEAMSRPPQCPKEVHELMLRCCSHNPAARPSFADIRKTFKGWRGSYLFQQGQRQGSGNRSAAPTSAAQAIPGALQLPPPPSSSGRFHQTTAAPSEAEPALCSPLVSVSAPGGSSRPRHSPPRSIGGHHGPPGAGNQVMEEGAVGLKPLQLSQLSAASELPHGRPNHLHSLEDAELEATRAWLASSTTPEVKLQQQEWMSAQPGAEPRGIVRVKSIVHSLPLQPWIGEAQHQPCASGSISEDGSGSLREGHTCTPMAARGNPTVEAAPPAPTELETPPLPGEGSGGEPVASPDVVYVPAFDTQRSGVLHGAAEDLVTVSKALTEVTVTSGQLPQLHDADQAASAAPDGLPLMSGRQSFDNANRRASLSHVWDSGGSALAAPDGLRLDVTDPMSFDVEAAIDPLSSLTSAPSASAGREGQVWALALPRPVLQLPLPPATAWGDGRVLTGSGNRSSSGVFAAGSPSSRPAGFARASKGLAQVLPPSWEGSAATQQLLQQRHDAVTASSGHSPYLDLKALVRIQAWQQPAAAGSYRDVGT